LDNGKCLELQINSLGVLPCSPKTLTVTQTVDPDFDIWVKFSVNSDNKLLMLGTNHKCFGQASAIFLNVYKIFPMLGLSGL